MVGWISPSGKLYECSAYEHYEKAKEIGDKSGGKYLEAAGWIQLKWNGTMGSFRWTQAQWDTLWDIVSQYDPESLNGLELRLSMKQQQELEEEDGIY